MSISTNLLEHIREKTIKQMNKIFKEMNKDIEEHKIDINNKDMKEVEELTKFLKDVDYLINMNKDEEEKRKEKPSKYW